MAKLVISNAFSLNMLSGVVTPGKSMTIECRGLTVEAARAEFRQSKDTGVEILFGVGHPDLAEIVSRDLELDQADREAILRAANERPTISLESGDGLLVAQYVGPRLSPGTTVLPPGARIQYFLLEVK